MTRRSRFAGLAVLLATGFLLFVSRPAFAFDPDTDHTCVYNCGDDSGGPSYSRGGCNVLCQGIRGILGIGTPAAPSGPSPAQIEAARRARIEANQQSQAAQQRENEAKFRADRDAAAAELKGVGGGDSGLKGGDSAALHQLPSTALTGSAATQFDNEPAKDLSSCGFDDARGCAKAAPVTVPKVAGAKPAGVAALWDRLSPDAQKDPEIKQNVAFLTKLETRKTEKQQQLAALEKQIGQGGDTALAAKKSTLENDLKQIAKDEQKAAEQIGKRMADRHLGWNEGK